MSHAPRTIGPRVSRVLRAYHLGPDHPMKLRLWSLFRRVTGYPRLTMPYAGKGWITVDERDFVQREIYVSGEYEAEVWHHLAQYLVPGAIVWDIGAHIGTFAIRALLDERVRKCHAFEPDPNQARALEINLTLNRRGGVIHRIALSDTNERRAFSHGPDINTGLSSLVAGDEPGTFEVACCTAERLVFDQGVDAPTVVKIDVEGWELQVLRGMQRVLAERPPRAIAFESACDADGHIANRELVRLLTDAGYDIRWVVRPAPSVDEKENFVATHRTLCTPVSAS